MNVPNVITMIRIVLVPVIVIFLIDGELLKALLFFLLAGIGDGLDGFFARALNQKTALGAFLDPMADKLLLTTVYVVMAFYHLAPGWLAVLVASRDLLIVAGLGVLAWNSHFPSMRPTLDSKITTFLQIVTLAYLLSSNYLPGLEWLKVPLVWATALFTIVSGIRYIIIGFRLLESEELRKDR
jgi:cardiolipin synthase